MSFIQGQPIQIGQAEPGTVERRRYPVFVTLLSGGVIYHDAGHPDSWKMYIDLATLTFNEKLLINYNHNDSEIIGVGENARVEGGHAVCDGFVIPFKPDDRAAEVVFRASEGTPFESSVEFTPDAADITELSEGGTAEVNGETVEGPAYIYRNVHIRAFAICPLGADSGTQTTFLNKKGKKSMSIFNRKKPTANLSEEEPQKEEGLDEGTSQYPDLDELQSLFGDELGVRLFKDGVALEDARKISEFNEKYGLVAKPDDAALEGETGEKKDDAALEGETEEKKDEAALEGETDEKKESAELRAMVAKLAASNSKLTTELAKLGARLTAATGEEPVSATHAGNGKANLSAKDEYIAAFSRRFK